ncbi:MAG: hypothetical protein GQ569_12960, partial [Methylococcaceae bacterium]|nr:hypothetical protein [Methylococcaceae bacterium]
MGFLAAYIMRGRTQAIMVASSLALLSLPLPPASIVSSAAVALVTLRRGASEGAYILLCACLASAVLGALLVGDYQLTLFYTLFLWAPVWVISVILREGRHLFLAIEIVVMIAMLAVTAAFLYQPDLAEVWKTWLNGLLEPMVIKANPEVPEEDIQRSLSVFYRYILTGLVAEIYVLSLLAGLFLARWWQATLYNPGGFKKEYLALKGQKTLAIATIFIVAAAWFFSGIIAEICWNITVLLFVLYAFLGTVVLHCTFSSMNRKKILVPFLYISMILIPHAMIPAAIIG